MEIIELTLHTTNLEDTARYYSNVLGMQVTHIDNEEISIAAGKTQLRFAAAKEGNPLYHFAFNIPANQIEAAREWCAGKKIELIPYLQETLVNFPDWNAHSIYFTDNNGNILEFIARHDLNNDSTAAFGPASILTVSEIGLVTNDVTQLCKTLSETSGIAYYEKQPPSPGFSVMGDTNGLLIVVPVNRNWFPTNTASAQYPLQVVYRHGGETHTLVM
jgi:catechol 2,3-dioxygenase-like lactoylglutathione lyase family enzyme